jgi:lipoate-protein ligase B
MNGAWADDGKIAAIGFRLKRWITMHGMSLNVSVNLEGFQTIVPCGLHGESVTSLKKILGDRCPSMEWVRDRMVHHFSQVCSRPLEMFQHSGKLPEPLTQLLSPIGIEAGPMNRATPAVKK